MPGISALEPSQWIQIGSPRGPSHSQQAFQKGDQCGSFQNLSICLLFGWCLLACLPSRKIPALPGKKADVPCRHLGGLASAGSPISLARGNFEEIHPGFSSSMGVSVATINLFLPPQDDVLVVVCSIPQPPCPVCQSSEFGDASWARDRLRKPSGCPLLVHSFGHRQRGVAALTLPGTAQPLPGWRVPYGQALLQGVSLEPNWQTFHAHCTRPQSSQRRPTAQLRLILVCRQRITLPTSPLAPALPPCLSFSFFGSLSLFPSPSISLSLMHGHTQRSTLSQDRAYAPQSRSTEPLGKGMWSKPRED